MAESEGRLYDNLCRYGDKVAKRGGAVQNGIMRRCLPILAALFLAVLPAGAKTLPSNEWSLVAGPAAGPAQAIGGFAHGCLEGAATLPPDGPGYAAIRLSRKRNYGHPSLVGFLQGLGRKALAAGLPGFYVGDMAQARGGPLPFGHASHQSGLDVDIWFTPKPATVPPPAARETVDLPSMLTSDFSRVDPRRFGQTQIAMLRLAAADPAVERIFVSPVIKLALCRNYGGAVRDGSAWLHRLSPWWYHDDHFHVRLHCPADSPLCESQPPVPPGDGCDAGLADWARHPMPPAMPGEPPPPHPHLPAICVAVLDER